MAFIDHLYIGSSHCLVYKRDPLGWVVRDQWFHTEGNRSLVRAPLLIPMALFVFLFLIWVEFVVDLCVYAVASLQICYEHQCASGRSHSTLPRCLAAQARRWWGVQYTWSPGRRWPWPFRPPTTGDSHPRACATSSVPALFLKTFSGLSICDPSCVLHLTMPLFPYIISSIICWSLISIFFILLCDGMAQEEVNHAYTIRLTIQRNTDPIGWYFGYCCATTYVYFICLANDLKQCIAHVPASR